MGNDETPVACAACSEHVELVRRSSKGLFLTCGCSGRGIDVTDDVGTSTLFDPFSGHWSSLDD